MNKIRENQIRIQGKLLDSLLRNYINANLNDGNFQISDFTRALQNGEIEVFINLLTNLLAEVPYYESGDKIYENRFRDIMFIICRLMGMSVHCEIHTCSGRIDMTVETDRFIYIMEFKIDRSPKEALQQINDKRYADRYLALGRTVMKVGVEFSTNERNIGDWEYEVV